MNDIGWGLLLNLIFWVVVVSAMVFMGIWACVGFFLGAAQQVRKTIRAGSGRKVSPDTAPVREESGERYRKAS